jgi:putative acetyltransferase
MSQIIIRRVSETDIDDLVDIYASSEVLANTAQIPYRAPQFWGDFYRTRDPQGVELVAVVDGRVVGHLGLTLNHTPRRKHAATFGICVHPDFHGQGVGTALMAEMCHLADDWLNLVRLELSVASDNAAAIALYTKFGFVTEGEARWDIFRAGRYAHSTRMARIRPSASDALSLPD